MFTSAGLLYYRTDLLKKYGLEVPGTWDDLEHAAAVIQRGERAAGNPAFHGFIFQADAYEGLTCTALEWLVSNNAGAIISQDKRVTVDNPAAAEMLGRAARWVGSIAPRAVTTFKEENCRNLWQGGNAAFMRNWPYCYTLGNAPDSPIRGKFGVAPVPAGQGSNAGTLGGWQMAVSRYTRHPGLASDIAAHLCSRPIQKLRATHGSFNPTVPDLYSDPDVLSANPFLGKLLDVFVNAVARPSNVTGKDYPEVSRIFYTNVHAVITGDMAPASACRQISHDIQALTGFEAGPPTTRQER
jgi:trehalose/maltose transport system substrate-binding protein